MVLQRLPWFHAPPPAEDFQGITDGDVHVQTDVDRVDDELKVSESIAGFIVGKVTGKG